MTNLNKVSGVASNLVKTHSIGTYYGVWAKHACSAKLYGAEFSPKSVVEVGPGSTLAVGLCALLCGADRYYAFDLVKHTDLQANIAMLDKLVQAFTARAPVKNARGGFPDYSAFLNEGGFPDAVLPQDQADQFLQPERVDAIRRAILHGQSDDRFNIVVEYVAPWETSDRISDLAASIDVVISHSTMEHVDNLQLAYSHFAKIVRSGGIMSHQIDFRSHGFSKAWNGYRAFDDEQWRELTSETPYSINRVPASQHLDNIRREGFDVYNLQSRFQPDSVGKNATASFADLSDYDKRCSGIFVQSIKR